MKAWRQLATQNPLRKVLAGMAPDGGKRADMLRKGEGRIRIGRHCTHQIKMKATPSALFFRMMHHGGWMAPARDGIVI